MLPPAPARLSATTCTPHDSVSRCAARRPRMSVGPPGGNGMMKRTGLDGYDCASAQGVPATQSRATAILLTEFIAVPPLRLRPSLRRNPDFMPLRGQGRRGAPLVSAIGRWLLRRAPYGPGRYAK